MGRELKVHKNLTRRRLVFVKRILDGETGTQSALAAYHTTNPIVARVIASENLTKPYVLEAIEEGLNSQGLSLSTVVSSITEIARSKPSRISGETKLKANIELLKLYRAYPENKGNLPDNQVKALSYDEAKKQFKQLSIEANDFIVEVESS